MAASIGLSGISDGVSGRCQLMSGISDGVSGRRQLVSAQQGYPVLVYLKESSIFGATHNNIPFAIGYKAFVVPKCDDIALITEFADR